MAHKVEPFSQNSAARPRHEKIWTKLKRVASLTPMAACEARGRAARRSNNESRTQGHKSLWRPTYSRWNRYVRSSPMAILPTSAWRDLRALPAARPVGIGPAPRPRIGCFDNVRVSPQAILAPHRQETAKRMAGCGGRVGDAGYGFFSR